jgi:hypothetical protein
MSFSWYGNNDTILENSIHKMGVRWGIYAKGSETHDSPLHRADRQSEEEGEKNNKTL